MSEHRSSEFGTAMSGLILVVMVILAVYFLTAARFAEMNRVPATPEEVAARLAPVGQVALAGEAASSPAVAQVPATTEQDQGPGAKTYHKVCAACHGTGAAGAPKFGDRTAWDPRAARGFDALLATALQGKGAMPPRGTCATCSDEELRAAVQYMLAEVGFDFSEDASATETTPQGMAPEASPAPAAPETPAGMGDSPEPSGNGG